MKISTKRKAMQILAFVISNLGFTRILKSGFVCPFLYCYGCPFATFGCPIGILQNFVIYQQFPFFAVGSLGVYGVLFGRAFCGWACPFGALQDLISYLRGERKFKTSRYWYTKYVVLFFTFFSAWVSLDTFFCKLCPSGSLFAAIPFYVLNSNSSFSVFFYIHVLTLGGTLVSSYLVSRFWCRYLCPLAAISGTFNKVSLLSIHLDEKKCTRCDVCLEVCEMGVDKVSDINRSTDCILCGRCVEKCPNEALSFVMK